METTTADISVLATLHTRVLTSLLGISPVDRSEHALWFATPNGLSMCLLLDEDDPGFLNLLHVSTLEEIGLDAGEVARLCNKLMAEVKSIKAVVRGELLFLSIESGIVGPDTLPSPELLAAVLPRAFRTMELGVNVAWVRQ